MLYINKYIRQNSPIYQSIEQKNLKFFLTLSEKMYILYIILIIV